MATNTFKGCTWATVSIKSFEPILRKCSLKLFLFERKLPLGTVLKKTDFGTSLLPHSVIQLKRHIWIGWCQETSQSQLGFQMSVMCAWVVYWRLGKSVSLAPCLFRYLKNVWIINHFINLLSALHIVWKWTHQCTVRFKVPLPSVKILIEQKPLRDC